jgi:8-hydroxy-5-deazaflavin:NADPH oxidoreductase
MRIAIIGKGNVGSALGKGLSRAGHEVKYGHRDPKEPVAEAASWGEIIVLAVPYEATADAAREIGVFADGKTVVDVTNAIGENMELGISCSISTAEQTQKWLPKAHVVKAFNTVFAKNQSTGKVDNEKLTAFIAGDDANAKKNVAKLTSDIGFDPLDVGPLSTARYLDAMGNMIINLAFKYGMGTNIGYKLVKA